MLFAYGMLAMDMRSSGLRKYWLRAEERSRETFLNLVSEPHVKPYESMP